MDFKDTLIYLRKEFHSAYSSDFVRNYLITGKSESTFIEFIRLCSKYLIYVIYIKYNQFHKGNTEILISN